MKITDAPSRDPLAVAPVTTPAGSVYDTPQPPVTRVSVPAVPTPAMPPTETASTQSSGDDANASAPDSSTAAVDGVKVVGAKVDETKIDATKIDGTNIDGATSTNSQPGIQTATILVPLTPEQRKRDASNAPTRTPGSILFDQTRDDSTLDPTSWSVSVFKRRQELTVYYKGRLFKRYDAVFGRALDLGAKQWAQDCRTPEGVYTIIEKYPSARFHWFLRLNYPNLVDRVRYETQRINGVVPVDDDGKEPTVGSAIGIHGTDVPILNSGHINWTMGCISPSNKDVEELERLLPVGTVVIIKP